MPLLTKTKNIQYAIAISARLYHTVLVYNDGSVSDNGVIYAFGQLPDDQGDELEILLTGLGNQTLVTTAAVGQIHIIFMTNTNKLYGIGLNYYGQLRDDSVTDSDTPVQVITPPSAQPVAIVAGLYHSAFLDATGKVYTWDYNGYGQLGIGDIFSSSMVISFPSEFRLDAISNSPDPSILHPLPISVSSKDCTSNICSPCTSFKFAYPAITK